MIFKISLIRQNKFFSLFLFCFFLLLTFILYFQSIHNFFVLDDFIFLKAATQHSLSANFHFFPIPLLSYRIIYMIFGLNPAPVRLFSFVLNALVCLFVYKLSYKVFENLDKENDDKTKFLKSFLCSLLFAVHYIHVETIIYFSELHELFYSLFYILGLFTYFKYKENEKRSDLLLIFVFYLLCILSKETAVSFVLCLFLSELFLFKNKISVFFRKFYFLLIITFSFILLRYFAFPGLNKLDYSVNFIILATEIFKNLIFTFTAFIVSLDFTYIKDIYKLNNSSILDTARNIFIEYPAALVHIFISIVLYLTIFLKRDRIINSTFAFILITILSFAWLAGYERYLYLPSAGFCIMIFHYAFKVSQQKKYIKNVLIAVFIFFFTYNIYSLEQKEANWSIASQMSFKTVSQIVNLTKNLPPGSEVYFNDMPSDYKGAWILRDGIHELPELFVQRNDIKFYYFYEMPVENKSDKNIYIYDYWQNRLIQK